MSRERSGSGTCYTCKEPLVGQKCICRSCLENPIQGLGDLYAKRRELIIKSSELQESLRVLMKGQDIEETQQIELRIWRDKAQKARIARERALAQLQTLSATGQAAESNASFASAKSALASSIDQLILYLETKRRRFLSSERRLLDKLHAYEVEKQKYRRWAVEDIKLVLEGTVKPPDKPRSISSTADLVEQCAANNKLAKYYSEAFGQFVLLLGAVSTVFQLPLQNHFKYQGSRSEIWVPSTFYDCQPSQHKSTPPHVLCLTAASGSSSNTEAHKKAILQAVSFLERSAAVALSARPELAPRFSVVVSPLEWISEVCEAAIRERSPRKGANDHVQQSVEILKEIPVEAAVEEDNEDSEPLHRDHHLNEANNTGVADDGDWELLKAADAEAAIELQIEAESSISSLVSMVNKVKTFAYSYKVR
ncbi:hypothetical protein Ndes2526B_g02985 [Nannochloris sp. 'desiccata']